MEALSNRPSWLDSLGDGAHACFFYTTEEEFLSIVTPYLKDSLENSRDRLLWILPPTFSLAKAKEFLAETIVHPLDFLLKRRRLILLPWEKWYGSEMAIQALLNRTSELLKEAEQSGFDGLRVLTHSPDRSSSYWKDFFLYEESFPNRFRKKPVISLCAYSLIDCPAQAISSIALNHSLCLIHQGSEWEWLQNKNPKSVAFSNAL